MVVRLIVILCLLIINLVRGNEESLEAVTTRTIGSEEQLAINEDADAFNSRTVSDELVDERGHDVNSDEAEQNDEASGRTFEYDTSEMNVENESTLKEHKDTSDLNQTEANERLETLVDPEEFSSLEETIVTEHISDISDPEVRLEDISSIHEEPVTFSQFDDSRTVAAHEEKPNVATSNSDTLGRMIQDVLVETKGRMASASSELEEVKFGPPTYLANFRTMDSPLPRRSVSEMLFPQYYASLKGYGHPYYSPISKQPPIYNSVQNYRRSEIGPVAVTDKSYNHRIQDGETRTDSRILDFNADSNAYPYSPTVTVPAPTDPPNPVEPKSINFYNELVETINKRKQKPKPYPYINEQYYPENIYANHYYPGLFNSYGTNKRFR